MSPGHGTPHTGPAARALYQRSYPRSLQQLLTHDSQTPTAKPDSPVTSLAHRYRQAQEHLPLEPHSGWTLPGPRSAVFRVPARTPCPANGNIRTKDNRAFAEVHVA